VDTSNSTMRGALKPPASCTSASGWTFGAFVVATAGGLGGAAVAISVLTKLNRASMVEVLIHDGPPSQPLTLGGLSGSWPMRVSTPGKLTGIWVAPM
jgi:hypothetical protein